MDTLRVGIIGCGQICRVRHAPEYSENSENSENSKNSENSENSTEQTSPVESDKFSFPWWIVAVIAAVVFGGGILAIVLIRKGSDK